jgi:hypothetical protein
LKSYRLSWYVYPSALFSCGKGAYRELRIIRSPFLFSCAYAWVQLITIRKNIPVIMKNNIFIKILPQ